MQPEIKLVISQNNKTIQTVIEQVNDNFVKTIEHFQDVANATFTKMIEELGGSGDGIADEEEEDNSEPDEDVCTSPKRKKK